jgi:hypothetical protein
MGDENHNDTGAELAALRAKVANLESRLVELEHHRLLGIVVMGGPDAVAEFLKAHPEHADVAAAMKAEWEAERAERQRQRVGHPTVATMRAELGNEATEGANAA